MSRDQTCLGYALQEGGRRLSSRFLTDFERSDPFYVICAICVT